MATLMCNTTLNINSCNTFFIFFLLTRRSTPTVTPTPWEARGRPGRSRRSPAYFGSAFGGRPKGQHRPIRQRCCTNVYILHETRCCTLYTDSSFYACKKLRFFREYGFVTRLHHTLPHCRILFLLRPHRGHAPDSKT